MAPYEGGPQKVQLRGAGHCYGPKACSKGARPLGGAKPTQSLGYRFHEPFRPRCAQALMPPRAPGELTRPHLFLERSLGFCVAVFHGRFATELHPALFIDSDAFDPDQVPDLDDILHAFHPEIG